jgi:flavin-binding protein dodecin
MAQRTRPARRAAIGGAAPTGRDGAIDFVGRARALNPKAAAAPDHHNYRVIELVGSSDESIEDAIQSAIGRAHKTLRHLRWFEMIRTSGHIEDGEVRHYQVTLKVGFRMDDPPDR